MARDVEFNVTANDKTGNALAEAERKFKASNKRIEDENKRHADKLGDVLGKGLADSLAKSAPKLSASLGSAFTAASDYAAPLLAGGVAAATPLIAATLSAAITGGVALGAAGIGVALVAQDARVQAAGKQLSAHFMAALHADAAPFIAPVLAGIATVETRFDELRPTIANIFKNSSTFVQPLVDGATRGAAGIVRGVDQLVAKAQPVVDALGNSLGDLGEDFGDFLAGVDTTGAVAAINDLTDATGTLLDVTGPLLSGLSKVYGVLSKFGVVKEVAQSLLGPIGMLAPLLGGADGKFRAVSASTDAATTSFQTGAPAADDYATALTKADQSAKDLTAAQRTLYGSETDVAGALADATKEIKENGKGLDVNTQKGRDNRTALENVANTLTSNYEAYVKVNGEGTKSAGVAETNRAAFIKLAEKAGYSATEAGKLATQLGLIPTKKETKLSADAAKAKAEIAALKAKLAGIQDKTVQLRVQVAQGQLNNAAHTIARLGGEFSATRAFAISAGQQQGGNVSRTGGPTPVNVDQHLTVQLDGRPFYEFTTRKISESNKRTAWRAKVGRR